MDLDLQIGDLRKSVTFEIVDDLDVSLIVGTTYQNKFIEAILYKKNRLLPANKRAIATLDRFVSFACTPEPEDGAQPSRAPLYRRTVVPLYPRYSG